MFAAGTSPLLYAFTIHAIAWYPGELGEVKAGVSCAVSTEPPNAAVSWYQQVDRPSAVANWMSSGLAMPLALPTFFSAAVNPASVVGMVVMPALAKSFWFTVVTRKDESNGRPSSCPLETNVFSCGMSDSRVAWLKYWLSG